MKKLTKREAEIAKFIIELREIQNEKIENYEHSTQKISAISAYNELSKILEFIESKSV